MLYDFEAERQRQFTRRSLLLGGVQAGLLGALIARMYYLQVTEGTRFATLAEENRINVQLLAPTRGLILDRFGAKLAINEQNFRLLLVPEQTGGLDETIAKLTKLIGLTEADLRRLKRELARARKFMPVTVDENLTYAQAAAVQTRLPELPGVSIDVGQIRSYPMGAATGHVLGYVSSVSEADMKGDPDPVLSLPGFQVGKTGMEKLLDRDLRGRAGTADLEVNAFGRVIREVDRRVGLAGPTTKLTLDAELQRYVQQRLMTERSASAVVMDVHTGAVYALASHPSFDPNTFSRGINQAEWQALMNDETMPLTNKATSGLYSPGSTFKMVTALASLEAGVTTPAHQVPCYGAIELGNHYFHCWKRGGHGMMDLVGAVRESCDIYFYDLARKVGIDRIADMARRLGLGSVTGIDLPDDKAGLVPDRAWKEAKRGEAWQPGETLIAAIGQGALQTTPLQLAVMTARLVNGGKAVVPHLTKEMVGLRQEQTEWPSMGFDPGNVASIIAAMNSVCLDKRGTAFSARITEAGREMGGKTGTSQVRRISMAERREGITKNEDRPWRLRDHALFVGYAPVSAPRYAVAVVVEHGGGGSAVAAPIARDILVEAQRLEPNREQRPPMTASTVVTPASAENDRFGGNDQPEPE